MTKPAPTAGTAGVRALRCAAALPLADVASSAGVDWLRLRDQLHALTPRGVCAAAAAEIVAAGETQRTLGATQHILDALNHRACPPYATRSAIGYGTLNPMPRVATAAGWSTRDAGPHATRAALVRLAATQHRGRTSIQAVLHRRTPAAILDALACDSDPDVVYNVARNPNTSTATLARLGASTTQSVRRETANNPSTSAATLTLLAEDPSPAVRRETARNPSTSAATLTLLAKDPDSVVRGRVAHNPSTSRRDVDAARQRPGLGRPRQGGAQPRHPAERLRLGSEPASPARRRPDQRNQHRSGVRCVRLP